MYVQFGCVCPNNTPTVGVGDDLLPLVGGAFPSLSLSPAMLRVLWQKQVAQIQGLVGEARSQRRSGLGVKVRDIERRHEALVSLIKKEVEHTQRMVNFKLCTYIYLSSYCVVSSTISSPNALVVRLC